MPCATSAPYHQLPCISSRKAASPETGLYYYGARYLDPKTSLWLSSDPALGEYIPAAPVNDDAKKHNQNLPGMGGVFNTVNLHLYHYAGNNPIKYTDPTGRFFGIDDAVGALVQCIFDGKWSDFGNKFTSNFINSSLLLLNVFNTLNGVKNFGDFISRIVELISRFTWSIGSTLVAFFIGYFAVIFFGGTYSNYKNLSIIQTDGSYGAFTIGFVSVGDKTTLADDVTRVHEFGHYRISLLLGLHYLFHAVASVIHAIHHGPADLSYYEYQTEAEADRFGDVIVTRDASGAIIERRIK